RCLSDWSSDVCSSDLEGRVAPTAICDRTRGARPCLLLRAKAGEAASRWALAGPLCPWRHACRPGETTCSNAEDPHQSLPVPVLRSEERRVGKERRCVV